MSISISGGKFVYGQPPYFDNTFVSFSPVGTTYNYAPDDKANGLLNYNLAIQYGMSFGNSRKKMCLRRYVYQYNINTNIFTYYKTYKGVRNFKNLNSVVDLDELNARSQIHSTEITDEAEPTFITNSILHSLFSFPSNNDYFFVEGSHYNNIINYDYLTKPKNKAIQPIDKPNFFKIYRYGKIVNNNIVVCKNNFLISQRIV
jgi:hypothetical protein